MRPERVRKKPSRGGSFSKATPHCPAKGHEFSRSLPGLPNGEKPLDSSGFAYLSGSGARPSEPLAAVPVGSAVAVVTVAVETVERRAAVAVHHAVAPAAKAAVSHAGQDGKTALLAL